MARPRTNPDKHRRNIALTLDPELLTRARALAAQRGKSLSMLVEQLLSDWIRKSGASNTEIELAILAFIRDHEAVVSVQDAKKHPKKAQKVTP